MRLTLHQIRAGTGAINPDPNWLTEIQAACDEFGINTPLRIAAFLAQIGVESAGLTAVVENLNYSAIALPKMWPSRFSQDLANKIGRTAEHPADQRSIANVAYANRGGNGDVASDDGWNHRGRGLIQVTFKSNYIQMGKFLNLDLLNHPELLETQANAARSAACFFVKNKCLNYADSGNFLAICGIVNCGNPSASAAQIHGFDARYALYKKALLALGLTS